MSVFTIKTCFKKFNISRSLRFFCSNKDPPKYFTNKYKVFKDEDSNIILDVDEEKFKKQSTLAMANKQVTPLMENFNQSSKSIVEEVVELIKFNKAENVVVIKLASELKYAKFMIITSALSQRHVLGLAELVKKHFKHKINTAVGFSKPEGANSDWLALDLDHLVLHIMMDSIRSVYDLESLWAIGSKYDSKLNSENDDILELLKQHSVTLDDLKPAKGLPTI